MGNGPLAETHSRTAPKPWLPWAAPTLDAWNPSTASTEHRYSAPHPTPRSVFIYPVETARQGAALLTVELKTISVNPRPPTL